MRYPAPDPELVARAVELRRAGVQLPEIARQLGHTKYAVQKWVRKAGLTERPRTVLQQKVEAMILEARLTGPKIALALGVSKKMVEITRTHLRRQGVTVPIVVPPCNRPSAHYIEAVRLYNEGVPRPEIAKRLKVNRNVISGIMKRAFDRGEAQKREDVTPRQRTAKARAEYVAKAREAIGKRSSLKTKFGEQRVIPNEARLNDIAIAMECAEIPVLESGGVSIMELRRTACRAVIRQDEWGEKFFCGDEMKRGSYCQVHALLFYRPPPDKNRKRPVKTAAVPILKYRATVW